MPTTGGNWIFFNEFKKQLGLKTVDLVGDTFKMALMPSTWTPNIDTQDDWSDISAQEISGNGYAQQTLGSKTWTRDDAADKVVWGAATASFGPADGGPIAARRAVIYDDTTTPKYLVAHCLLDATNQDVSAPDGVSLEVSLPSGIGALA